MFQTQNFTIIECNKCYERTVLEPGKTFDKLNCKCVKEVSNGEEVKPRAARQTQRKSQTK